MKKFCKGHKIKEDTSLFSQSNKTVDGLNDYCNVYRDERTRKRETKAIETGMTAEERKGHLMMYLSGGKCQCKGGCDAHLLHNLTIDHIVPRSKGGAEDDLNNLQVLCFGCNRSKNDGNRCTINHSGLKTMSEMHD